MWPPLTAPVHMTPLILAFTAGQEMTQKWLKNKNNLKKKHCCCLLLGVFTRANAWVTTLSVAGACKLYFCDTTVVTVCLDVLCFVTHLTCVSSDLCHDA